MSDVICSGCKGASSSGCYLCNPSAPPSASWEEVYRVQTARIAELEAENKIHRESRGESNGKRVAMLVKAEQRAEAAEARLADIVGLQRYEQMYGGFIPVSDGKWIPAYKLQNILNQEQGHV